MKRSWAAVPALLIVASVMGARPAWSNPRPLPMTYNSETQVAGGLEVETYTDLAPLRALSARDGQPVWYTGMAFQVELEYGLTNRLELGLYATLAPGPGEGYVGASGLPVGNGLKQRLRYLLADPGAWPVDVAVYGELVETQTEIEVEAKIILQRRLGPARAVINLSAEREIYLSGKHEWVLNPTAGVTVEVTPRFHPGFEAWTWTEFPDSAPRSRTFALGPHVYVGPAFMWSSSRLWWTTGVYARVSDPSHAVAPGEPFGKMWARTVVGLGF